MSEYYLPNLIKNQYIPTIAKVYAQNNKTDLQKILVNAKISINEAVRYDNWNGGTYFHDVTLTIPEELFLSIIDNKDVYAKDIDMELNKFTNQNDSEFVENVYIEMDVLEEEDDWREKSGVLLNKSHVVSPVHQNRIWEKNKYRIFLSHKTIDKKNVANLKNELAIYGISCFVAHEDIKPTKAWADEIENALFSMDGFVALMTETFHDSDWTDHEIGVAYGRGVEMLAVRMGKDPYGIIGRFQGLSANWESLPIEIMRHFLQFNEVRKTLVTAIENCTDWNDGNKMAKMFSFVDTMPIDLCERLLNAYKNNSSLRNSFGFNGNYPNSWGRGLVYYLKKWHPDKYSKTGK